MKGDPLVERILMVSADGHAGAPPAAYRDYLEARYIPDLEELIEHDRNWGGTAISQSRFGAETLELIDRGDAIKNGGELGAYELDRRLGELDREGVAAEVLIPGHQVAMLPFFGVINRPAAPDLRAAGARAYHRHLADGMAEAGGRLLGIAEPGPCLDMEATVAELEWVADQGFIGVAPPGQVADDDLPPLTSDYYDPFWRTCAERGLVLNIHAGWGLPQFGHLDDMKRAAVGDMSPEDQLQMQMTADLSIDTLPKDSPIRQALTKPRRALWQLIFAGVFDRYPDLRLVFTEVRADWIPSTLDVLEQYVARHADKPKRRIRDYWAEHCYAAPSSPRMYEIALRAEIGIDRIMFGMDYPHPEGTWPNTREWLRTTMAGVSEDEVRRFLGLNAVECYRLDAAKLGAVAERIGLLPDEVLGNPEPVDPRLVEQFHSRSGFARPPERVDPTFYDEMISEDAAALAST
jgi:predicted TIM-barrel fold metal-dependent hydrolase